MSADIFGPVFAGGIALMFIGVISAFVVAQMIEATDSYDDLANEAFDALNKEFDVEVESRESRGEEEVKDSVVKEDTTGGVIFTDD
ncbi:hypothetical protein ScalyP_jg866 [Parmales sp. scaly parma]|nr:hypothetical protein ScalyP_jg866 [Parmales sp. scaly parma]